MKIYILLQECEYASDEYAYLMHYYHDCMTIKQLEKFCLENHLTFNLNKMLLVDDAGHARFAIVEKDIELD
jgi:hypothetical protein